MHDNNKAIYRKPVFRKDVGDDSFKFLPPPQPTGKYPFHLSLSDVSDTVINNKMFFHMVGDTGSAMAPEYQMLVVKEMIEHFNNDNSPGSNPAFLYHLGDVVYHFGEAKEYYRQFFKPYERYPSPIFAIAGNHDSDVNPDAKKPYQSLDAFMHVFCNSSQNTTELARETTRKTQVQPNVYWTLDTPLATFIGMYSNVPKFGKITPEQQSWLVQELKDAAAAKQEKMLILCIHHAPYSADTNHGSSREMITVLEQAFEQADVQPDIVFSGHVHNYQRFTKRYSNGKQVPYIVSGAGGYATLFPIAEQNDPDYTDKSPLFDNVRLESFCDDKHGFLKLAIEKAEDGLTLSGEYYTIPNNGNKAEEQKATCFDHFTVKVPARAVHLVG